MAESKLSTKSDFFTASGDFDIAAFWESDEAKQIMKESYDRYNDEFRHFWPLSVRRWFAKVFKKS